MWQHGIDRPEAHEHGLGWSDPAAYTETTDLVMRYLTEPGAKQPDPEAIITNRFTGKIKLGASDWTSVRARVSEFDKYLS